jgi:hypothetical protein
VNPGTRAGRGVDMSRRSTDEVEDELSVDELESEGLGGGGTGATSTKRRGSENSSCSAIGALSPSV